MTPPLSARHPPHRARGDTLSLADYFVVDPEDGLSHIEGLADWPVETRLLGKAKPAEQPAGEEGGEGEGAAAEGAAAEGAAAESEEAEAAGRREAKGLAAFEAAWSEVDEALERINEFPLREEEIVGARLYTGPMFTKYNVPHATVSSRGGRRGGAHALTAPLPPSRAVAR